MDIREGIGYGVDMKKFTVTGEDSIIVNRGNTKIEIKEGTIKVEAGQIEVL